MKTHVIRLKKGDEAISKITEYCELNEIVSASFSGLGAASFAKLAIYNLDKKEYIRQEFSGIFEVLSYIGNISKLDNKTIVHSHAVLSDTTFKAFGGHVDELIASATLEIVIQQIDIKLTRKHDEEIGLNLLEL